MPIQLKRVYDDYDDADGYRVLVDRLWPRGVKKEDLSCELWARNLAPSTQARKEFGHKPENFERFRGRYRQELDANPGAADFAERLASLNDPTVTLLYAARDRTCNHAVILAEWLAERSGVPYSTRER